MKTPSNYGSENEETTFIRRVAAPDRRSSRRRQKKRVAIAAATVGLVAASGVVGYASMRSGSAATTETTTTASASEETQQLNTQNKEALSIPSFVSELDDPYYPPFSELDANNNGVVSQMEFLVKLSAHYDASTGQVNDSDLPDDIKDSLVEQLGDKYDVDSQCTINSYKALRSSSTAVNQDGLAKLYEKMDLCEHPTISIPDFLVDKYNLPPSEATTGSTTSDTDMDTTTTEVTTQVVTVTTDSGETVPIVVPQIPDGVDQTIVQVPNANGDYVSVIADVVTTSTGDQVLQIPNGEGGVTTIGVPSGSASGGSSTSTEDNTQVVTVTTGSGEAVPVVVPQIEDGADTAVVQVQNADGDYVSVTADVVTTSTGDQILQIPDGEGGVTTVEVPSGSASASGSKPTDSTQVLSVTTDSGESVPIVVPPIPDGADQTIVQVPNSDGDFVSVIADIVTTSTGDQILQIPDGEGGVTTVEIPSGSASGSSTSTEDNTQVLTVTTDSGETVPIVVPEIPYGADTAIVQVPNSDGDFISVTADVITTSTGDQILQIPDGEGGVTTVEVPSGSASAGTTSTTEDTDVDDIIESLGGYEDDNLASPDSTETVVQVTTSDGEQMNVIVPDAPVVDGQGVVEIPTDDGYQPIVVSEIPTSDGGAILQIPDGDGGFTSVQVTSAPIDATTDDNVDTVVQVATDDGGEISIVVPDVPAEDGKDVVQIPTADGYETITVDAIDTGDGNEVLLIPDGEGGVTPVQVTDSSADTTTIDDSTQTISVTTADGVEVPVIIPDVPAENGQDVVEIKNADGDYVPVTVDVIETQDGGEIMMIPDGAGGVTPVEVTPEPDVSTTDTNPVVSVTTDDGDVMPVIIPDVPAVDGQDVVEIQNSEGEFVPVTVDVIETEDGGQILQIPDGEGGVTPVKVTATPTISDTTATTTDDVFEIKDKEIIGIANEDGQYVPNVADVIITKDGSEILQIPSPDGGVISVTVMNGESSGSKGDSGQVMTVATGGGDVVPVIIPDVPAVDGKDVVEVQDSNGQFVPITVDVIETADGGEFIQIPDGSGGVTTVEVTSAPGTTTTGSSASSTPSLRGTDVDDVIQDIGGTTLDSDIADAIPDDTILTVPTTDGGDVAVIIPAAPAVDGNVVIEVQKDDGEFVSELVTAIPTDNGNILQIPDDNGGFTSIHVTDAPSATEQTTDAPAIVQVPSGEGSGTIIIIPDVPPIGGQDVVQIQTDDGIKTILVDETPTDDGGQILQIPDDNGGFISVEVTKAPVDVPEYMTKDQFKQQLADFYADKLHGFKDSAVQAELESDSIATKIQGLDDCIEQAANKFGWYGVYEQAPHFENAIDWVQHVCWAA